MWQIENYKENGLKIFEDILLSKIPIALISLLVVILSVYFITQKEGNTFVSKSTYPVDASKWIIENLDLNEMENIIYFSLNQKI